VTRFLGIGECMVEIAPAEDGRYTLGFAGDTFNTCWYLKRLAGMSVSVRYLSAIGDDDASERLRAFIRDAGIEPVLTVRRGHGVGLYLITLHEGERSFSYWRSTSAARTLADDLERLPALDHGDIVYFSGITLAILPPAGRVRLLDAVSRVRADGVRVAFDPNIRPRLWETPDEIRHWIAAGARAADIVLPSFSDEAAQFGDADPAAVATRYLGEGAGLVVVKNADAPVLAVTPDARVAVTPRRADPVVDTTAAGDAFNAGFLAALLDGAPLDTACAQGCTVARQVVGKRGALVEIGDEDDT